MKRQSLFIYLLLGTFHFFFSSYTLLPLTDIEKKGVVLSVRPGSYTDSSLQLSIRTSEKLYYSLDGQYPNETTGLLSGSLLLRQTTSVSLRFANHPLSENDTIYVGTYLLHYSSTLPIVCLTIPPAFLFDPVEGIYVGHISESGEPVGNCWLDIEKLVFFEFLNNRHLKLNHAAGIKIFGGMTRQNPEKSLRLIARKKYGPGKFKYPFFKTKNISEFNSIILRTSGNDYNGTRFLDMMCASLAKDIGVDYLAYQPSVLFVNGQYWGIHNIREKVNADYLESNHGVNIDKTDLIAVNGKAEIGSSARYNAAISYLENNNIESPYFADSILSYFDIDNYFRYISLQLYIVNIDSRGNVRSWQSNTTQGRFNWIFYDGDQSFYLPNVNYLSKRLSPVGTHWFNPPWSTVVLRKLTEVPAFRNQFINTYCFLNSTILSKDSLKNRINYFRNYLSPEIDRHVKRRGYHYTREYWENNVNKLYEYVDTRSMTSLLHFQEHYGLTSRYQLQIPAFKYSDKTKLKIDVHTIPSFPYTGTYFSEIPLTLSLSELHPAYQFKCWNDGVCEKTRIIYQHKDSILTFVPVIEPAAMSSLQGQLKISLVHTGTKETAPFIIVSKKPFEFKDAVFYIRNEKGDTLSILKPAPETEGLLLCAAGANAATSFYAILPSNFIDSKKLLLLSESRSLYITDKVGNIVDSVVLIGEKTGPSSPYYLREGGKMTGYINAPPVEKLQEKWYDGNFTYIIGGALLLILIIVLIIRIKK